MKVLTLPTSPPDPISGHPQQLWPRSMWASGWWRPPLGRGSSCGQGRIPWTQKPATSWLPKCEAFGGYKLPQKISPFYSCQPFKKNVVYILYILYFFSLGSGKWPFKRLICSSRSAQLSYLLTLPLAWWVLSLTTANHWEFGPQHIWVQINLLVRSTLNQLLVCMNAHLLIPKDQPAVQYPNLSPKQSVFCFHCSY